MNNRKTCILLSFLFPGFGHLLIGKYVNAVVFMFAAGFLWFAIFYRSSTLATFNNPRSFLVWAALIFIYLYSIIDAWVKVRKGKAGKGLPIKSILVPGIIIFLVLVFFISYSIFPYQLEYKKDQAYLKENFKNELLLRPLSEIKYPVKGYLITTGGFCWLMTQAGIANYLEPDIDFNTFVLYGNPTLFMAGRTEKERYGPALNGRHAFKNLGYTVYHGSTNPTHPPQVVYPDIEPENFIYFKKAEEEFLFIKKLLTAGIIPIVHIEDGFLGLAGYDSKGIWLTNPESIPEEEKPKNFLETVILDKTWFMSYDEFFKNWSGDNQFFWYKKTNPRKTEAEVYTENKKNALEAAQNIKTTIGILQNLKEHQNISWIYTYDFDTPSAVALYDYFLNKGNTELAQKYLEIAEIYDKERESLGPNLPQTASAQFLIQLLSRLHPYYEEAGNMWP